METNVFVKKFMNKTLIQYSADFTRALWQMTAEMTDGSVKTWNEWRDEPRILPHEKDGE